MRVLTIILLCLVFCGCSAIEPDKLLKVSKTPPPVVKETPAEVLLPATPPTPPEPDETPENNETVPVQKSPSKIIKVNGKFCEEYLLKKIKSEITTHSKLVKRKTFSADDGSISSELKEWLEIGENHEQPKTYELKYKSKKALLLNGYIVGSTGIASNFREWFIEINKKSATFWSLSDNPRLIFWDKGGELNYYQIDFSEIQNHFDDKEILYLNFRRFKIDQNGKPQMVSEEKDVQCD